MKLTVVLCSLPSRLKRFSTIENVCNQGIKHGVEVLYLGDNWSMTLNRKRNLLIGLARGEYITFVDDDDEVTLDYVETILGALESGRDCITFQSSVCINGSPAKICYYSKHFENEDLDDRYLRQPNHVMAWRKSIIKPYPDIVRGGDTIFAKEMVDLGYSEFAIDKVLYNYSFVSERSMI